MSEDSLYTRDRTLLKRAIDERDKIAQKYIYIKYKRFIYQFIKARVNFNEYIDDLVQEVFVNICDGKCHYTGNTDVRGYLCGIAKNVVKVHVRREESRVRANLIYKNKVSINHNLPSNIIIKSENCRFDYPREILLQAIPKLPKKSREALELVFIHKIKPPQAAKKLGCSSDIFRNRLHYGLKKLRKECLNFSDFLEA
jgi:RNA polymerase sigma-70 factor (ECF subfamily)